TDIRLNPAGPTILQLVTFVVEGLRHRDRNPELNRAANERSVEPFGCHADDRVWHVVQALRFSNNLRVTLEAIAPHLVADDHNRMRIVAYILACFEPAP